MITPDFTPEFGGIGIHVKCLIQSITKNKECNVTLLVCKMRQQNDENREYNSCPHIEEIINGNVRILDFNSGIQTKVDRFYKNHRIYKEEAYHDFRTINNCCDIETRILENLNILDEKYDLIHLHDAFNGPLAVILKKIYSCPLVTTIHGVNAEEYTMIDNLKRYTIFNSDYLITVNSEINNIVKKRYLAIKPTKVIYNSINFLDTKEILKNINMKHQEPYYLTFCGRIDMYKGVDVLLKAFQILDTKGRNIRLFIIGDGLQREAMEKMSKVLKIDNKVIWLGSLNHNEVMKYYRKSFCIIVPSTKEPFSTVALEGMSYGIPVICSDIGGFVEMITDGKDGILFKSGSEKNLSEKIEMLIENRAKRKEICCNALRTVEKKYTWDINARKTLEFYKNILSREVKENESFCSSSTSG